jgi:H2-forming N5,N10-methylenetetrahydromethanopterin dehydrogenase-like enzyme
MATEAVLAAAYNLKVVGRAGIGVDNVDIAAATKRGVVVMNTPYGNAVALVEIDGTVPDEVLDEIKALSQVVRADILQFSQLH